MKLACPKCHLRLRIPDQRVSESGAWAQCPRCQERFFINPAGSSIEELIRPPDKGQPASLASGTAGRRRDTSSQELLDRLKARQGQSPGASAYDPGLIIVYPEPAIPEWAYQAASVALLCLPLLAIFLLFNSANQRLDRGGALRPEPAVTAVDRLNNQEDPELIRKDLRTIKRDHMMRRRNVYGVGYGGPESRVFKYFMNRLAPGVCSSIEYLQIVVPNSGPPRFSVTALCLEPEGRRLEMQVAWDSTSNSRVTFPYSQRTESFDLYARPPQAGLAASGFPD